MSYRLSDPPKVSTGQRPWPTAVGRRKRAASKTIAVLPTMFTLGNLLCGFGSIFFASRDLHQDLPFGWTPLTFSAVFIFLGMAFDALDGRLARLTASTSDLGGQLDSMADMVTFGVAPAFLAVQLIGVATPFISVPNDRLFDRLVLVIACIYVACAALRLARFNVESMNEDSHQTFRGLPTPGAAGTVASFVILHQHFRIDKPDPMHWAVRLAAIGMVANLLLAGFAMVSRLRYVHVANRYFARQARFGTFAKMVVIGLLMIVSLQGVLAAGFVIYALSAPVAWLRQKIRSGRRPSTRKAV